MELYQETGLIYESTNPDDRRMKAYFPTEEMYLGEGGL